MPSSSSEGGHSEPVDKGIHNSHHLKEVLHTCGSGQCPVVPVYGHVLRNRKVYKVIVFLFLKKKWSLESQFSKVK